MGRKKYGHGVRANDNPQTWGTPRDSWMHMAREEFLDGVVYVLADFIRSIGAAGTMGEDDNELILFYAKNTVCIDSDRHREMVTTLLRYSELCE